MIREMFHKLGFIIIVLTFVTLGHTTKVPENEIDTSSVPCTCGIFLSGQFKKGSKKQPTGNAALLQEFEQQYPKSAIGIRQCTKKCLGTIVKHLSNSSSIICATTNRNCHKEKAHLFIKNRKDTWVNTKLSAGREFCCKDNVPYKCPL